MRTCAAFLILAVSVSACSTFGYVDKKAERMVQVCAAGLSEQTAARVIALTTDSQGSITIELENEIKGAIFADSSISGSDRVLIYERYLECIKNGGIETQKEDAKSIVQQVQSTNDYRAASFFSSYDWISKYSRRYKNIGDRAIECRLRVRGVLRNRSNGFILNVSETNDYAFTLSPGGVAHIKGEVGIEGFSDTRNIVTTDDFLECWYR